MYDHVKHILLQPSFQSKLNYQEFKISALAVTWAGSIAILNFSFKYIIDISYISVKCNHSKAILDDLLEYFT